MPAGDRPIATAAEIDSKVDEAVTAIESGDFSTALTKLLSAKALLSGKPDTRGRTTEMRYDRRSIDSLITDVRKQQTASQAAALGIQSTNIKYVPTTDTP